MDFIQGYTPHIFHRNEFHQFMICKLGARLDMIELRMPAGRLELQHVVRLSLSALAIQRKTRKFQNAITID